MVDETLLLACNDGVIIVQYNVIIQSLFILAHYRCGYCIGIERVIVNKYISINGSCNREAGIHRIYINQ